MRVAGLLRPSWLPANPPKVDVSQRPCDCEGSGWTRIEIAGVQRTTRCICFLKKHADKLAPKPKRTPRRAPRRAPSRGVSGRDRQFRDD